MTDRTGQTNFRISPALKTAAKDKAAARGEDLTKVVLKSLERYVRAE